MWNQSASSRIWTRVAVSISYDDNHFTTGRLIWGQEPCQVNVLLRCFTCVLLRYLRVLETAEKNVLPQVRLVLKGERIGKTKGEPAIWWKILKPLGQVTKNPLHDGKNVNLKSLFLSFSFYLSKDYFSFCLIFHFIFQGKYIIHIFFSEKFSWFLEVACSISIKLTLLVSWRLSFMTLFTDKNNHMSDQQNNKKEWKKVIKK